MPRIEVLDNKDLVEESITTPNYLLLYQDGDEWKIRSAFDIVSLLSQARIQQVLPVLLNLLSKLQNAK